MQSRYVSAISFSAAIFLVTLVSVFGSRTAPSQLQHFSPVNCLSQHETRHCLLHARPHFQKDCVHWKPATKTAAGDPIPQDCQLQPMNHWEIMNLLNGTTVLFIGDSTARRTGLQLRTFLSNTSFEDISQEQKSLLPSVFGEVSYQSVNLSTYVMSQWFPQMYELNASLAQDGNNWIQNRLKESRLRLDRWFGRRKLIVFHYSAWDVRRCIQRQGGMPYFQEVIDQLSDAITAIQHQPDVDAARDTVLVRLPIAHGCGFVPKNLLGTRYECSNGTRPMADPVNAMIHDFSIAMHDHLVKTHPEVGLIDVFSWTKAPKQPGRDRCAPTDERGIHFTSDASRIAYMQQVLFGARLYRCGKLS